MAENILKLRVDSEQYESKLKRAAEGLQHYVDSARRAGSSLEQVSSEALEFARSLGQMETKSTSATAKLAEMKKTFTELSVQYKNMTDQEKQSPFGRALAASLEQLKGRISESKSQLDEVNKSLNGNSGLSGALDSLAGKFGVNIQSLAGWGAALGAAKAALDVSKDALGANESAVDEWGRIVDSSKSLYEGFLNAINNGDITGYLGRMDEIVAAAKRAYDEMDRLGSLKTIQAPAISAQQSENDRIRQMIVSRRYIAPNDGRGAARGLVNGQVLTDAQVKQLERSLEGGLTKITTLIGNEVKQSNRAITAVYDRQAKNLGMSLSEFQRGTSSMSEFDRRLQGAKNYNRWQTEHSYVDQTTGRLMEPRSGNPYAQFKGWDVFRVDGKQFNDLVKLIQERDQRASQAYSMQGQAYRAINRAEGITPRGGSGGGGGRSGGGGAAEYIPLEGSIDAMSAKVQELQKAWRAAADDDSRAQIKVQIDEAQHSLDLMTGKVKEMTTLSAQTSGLGNGSTPLAGLDTTITNLKSPLEQLTEEMNRLAEAQAKALTPEAWQAYQRQIEATQEKMDEFTGQTSKGAKDNDKSWQNAASAIASVGSAMQSIEDPAAKVVGIVAQAIATIALGYAQATKVAAETSGPWGWIAFAATGMATMLSTISAIHSATGFSEGGQVKGNTYSGDQIYSRLDAGEVVLTRAMAGNLASQLNSPAGNLSLSASVEGEKIFLATNRFLKRSGRGEFVTWK